MNMRCTQPYISQAGKLAQQIQRLRSFGLSNPDFSQQITSRYSSFKLGRFQLATLTLLHKANSESSVFNTTQILKNEVIYSLPSISQIQLNLNLLFSWNKTVPKLRKEESNYQLPKLTSKLLTFSQSNSISITRTSPLPNTVRLRKVVGLDKQGEQRWKPASAQDARECPPRQGKQGSRGRRNYAYPNSIASLPIQPRKELTDPQPWLSQNVFLLTSQANFLARPLSIQSPKVGKESVVKLVPQLLVEVRGKEKGSKKTKLKHNFYPLLNQGLSNLGNSFTNTKVASEIELDRVDVGINKYHESVNLISRQNDREAGDLPQENKDLVEISDFPAKLKQTPTSMLIHSVNMSRIISTLESKFNLFQRQQNTETTSILQSRKTSLNYYDDLSLSPHHIRRRKSNQQRLLINELSPTSEEFIFRRQVDNAAANNQSPKDYAFSQATAMEFAQSQVIAKPISSRQESEMDRKNSWEKQTKANSSPPSIDVNRLEDQVYQAIERKIKIERQRRGLL